MVMTRSICLAMTAALLAGGGAVAEETSTLTPIEELAVNYDVNMGGLTLGEGRLRANFTDAAYDTRITIRTSGLAEWLFESRYENTSRGTRIGEGILPHEYNSDFRGRRQSDYQIVRIGYNDTTPYLIASDPSYGHRLERFPVTEEQRQNSYDPLNAAMHLVSGMSFSEEAPCGDRIRVFDGRRRYDIVMEHVGYRDIRVRGGEVWNGETLVCQLNYEEVAGFKPQPEDDELPRPPMTAFIAELDEGYFVPVRVRAPTPIGSLIMVATFMRVRDVTPEPVGAEAAEASDTTAAAPIN